MVAIINGEVSSLLAGASQTEAQWSYLWKTLLVSLAGLLVTTIVYAAAQRAVLRPREGGPGFLRLGMDEVRLFFLSLLYLVVFIVGVIVISFVFAIFMGGASTDASTTGAIVVLVVGAVLAAYFGTKLSLTFPLTIIREGYAVGEGWALTNGRFWTLFGAYFILFLIMLGTGIAIILATQQDYLQAVFQYGVNSDEAVRASLREYELLNAGEVDVQLVLHWVLSSIQGGIGFALCGGAVATAAQELTADEDGLSETFS
jgi:hypothetical protein